MDFCSLCFEKIIKISDNVINFKPCDHKICQKCAHFIMFDICRRGVDFSFFLSKEKEIQCNICSQGLTTIDLLKFSEKFLQDSQQTLENIPAEINSWFKALLDQYKATKNIILKEIMQKIKENNEKFHETIEKIISNVRELQKKHKERNIKEYNNIKKQLEIFEEPFLILLKDFKENNFEASRKYYIPKKKDDIFCFIDKNIKISTKNTKEDLKFIQREINLFKEKHKENKYSVFDHYAYFKINFPLQITSFPHDKISIDHEKFTINTQSFAPYNMKSDVSCSFYSNNIQFIAWAGYGFNQNNQNEEFPLKIWDLTKGNSMQIEGFSEISVVCTYPKTFLNASPQQWLCVADKQGNFQGFSIKSLGYYQIVRVFSFDTTKPISALTIFQDKSCEIDKNQDIYSIIAFDNNDNDNLKLFKFREGSWELITIIKAPSKCHVINNFYDIKENKTKIYFGFASKICGFDLRGRQLNNEEYLTNWKFSIIYFVFLERNNTYFLVYTKDDKEILIANLNNGAIIRNARISNIKDIAIWERKREKSDIEDIYLIIATSDSIKVRDFYNLNHEIYCQPSQKIVVNLINFGEKNIIKNGEIKNALVLVNFNEIMRNSEILKQCWEIVPAI